MGKVYCEFCGKAIDNIYNPKGLVGWTHNIYRDVVRCWDHHKTPKDRKLGWKSHDPFTGEKIQ